VYCFISSETAGTPGFVGPAPSAGFGRGVVSAAVDLGSGWVFFSSEAAGIPGLVETVSTGFTSTGALGPGLAIGTLESVD